MNELVLTQAPAVVTPVGDDYSVNVGGTALTLKRDVDFGRIPGTAKPCLYKSGAERIVLALGIDTQYTVESAIEEWQGDAPFFFYRVKCSCYKKIGDEVYHITDGMGSANSNERQCGRASKWDVANARLKIARKRAMTDAVLTFGLSNAFAQDIENDDFMKGAEAITNVLGDDDPISAKQRTRIYALATAAGISTKEAKKMIADAGFESASLITQKDYDRVCALFTKEVKE